MRVMRNRIDQAHRGPADTVGDGPLIDGAVIPDHGRSEER